MSWKSWICGLPYSMGPIHLRFFTRFVQILFVCIFRIFQFIFELNMIWANKQMDLKTKLRVFNSQLMEPRWIFDKQGLFICFLNELNFGYKLEGLINPMVGSGAFLAKTLKSQWTQLCQSSWKWTNHSVAEIHYYRFLCFFPVFIIYWIRGMKQAQRGQSWTFYALINVENQKFLYEHKECRWIASFLAISSSSLSSP